MEANLAPCRSNLTGMVKLMGSGSSSWFRAPSLASLVHVQFGEPDLRQELRAWEGRRNARQRTELALAEYLRMLHLGHDE